MRYGSGAGQLPVACALKITLFIKPGEQHGITINFRTLSNQNNIISSKAVSKKKKLSRYLYMYNKLAVGNSLIELLESFKINSIVYIAHVVAAS